ncbi:hypothetical protein ACHQM5_007360 [Ranunculus cassubicifolius]
MYRRLFEASLTGNVSELHQLLREDPLTLHAVSLSSAETPLHVAAMAGHLDFVKEVIRLKPEFIEQLNQDGFSPLHIASANGYVEIVREILSTNHSGGLMITSREKKTALHYAAMKGRINVIQELLSNCAETVEAVTIQGETAIHLAVKNDQFEAFEFMFQKLKGLGKEDVINRKDERGNTVLHLATYTKQRAVVELLLVGDILSLGTIELNAMNKSGLTAFDLLLLFPSEAGDREIEWILRGAGAKTAQDLCQLDPQPSLSNSPASESSHSPFGLLVDYFKFKRGRDSPSDARTALLVIAVLITAATFQAGYSPPGGVWQDNGTGTTPHSAGKSILSTTNKVQYGLYVYFNSFGFYMSLFLIQVLTNSFPLRLELQMCMIAVVCAYNLAILGMGPEGSWNILYNVFSAVCPMLLPFIARWFRLLYAKRRCLPSLSIGTSRWFG